VLYVPRALVAERIPLNGGCLLPVSIRIPPGSLLDPSSGAAVVGGNVETSQRVVDGRAQEGGAILPARSPRPRFRPGA